MLVLTDHRTHSAENSIYALAPALLAHPSCARLDIATRGLGRNNGFFKSNLSQAFYASPATADFHYDSNGYCYKKKLRRVTLQDYDVVFMRLPHPVEERFWQFVTDIYPERQIINQPSGIFLTGSKSFLLNVPELCPPIQLCQSIDDIQEFRSRFAIVLKPLRDYGGNGIIKIANDDVWQGNEHTTFAKFAETLKRAPIEYLGMQYLINVTQGDKRVIVCNRETLGASLRMPASGSWICNAAQGGMPTQSDITEEETKIAARLNEVLYERGIVLYGFDTLTDDAGKRVLSEVNTTSIGGIPQIGKLNNIPMVERVVDLIWTYVNEEMYGKYAAVA